MGIRGRGVLKGEQGIGKLIERLADTIGGGEGQEDIVTAIVVYSRREIEPPGPMFCPWTSVVTESHEQQVRGAIVVYGRVDGWGGRRNRREESADRAKQRVRGWTARHGGG